MERGMRGDQPVVSAASWMVRASVNAPNLTTIVSRFGGARSARGLQDGLAALVRRLVEGHDAFGRRVGVAQPRDDRGGRVLVIAGPRRIDGDRAAHVVGL